MPSVNKTLALELARCEFLARRENVLLLGNIGTGPGQGGELRSPDQRSVMHELLRKHAILFPQTKDPIFEAGSDEDSPR
jgi:hypothetical protein